MRQGLRKRCVTLKFQYKMKQRIRSTTVLCVRRDGKVVMAGDGQVTLGSEVLKSTARKLRRLYNDKIIAGFAGSTADAFSLFARFEAKLEQFNGNLPRAVVELAKDWRTDNILRHLEALLLVADAKNTFILSGNGDVIEPDEDVAAIGSGGPFAHSAATALMHNTKLTARQIAEEAMKIAGKICIYTNDNVIFEELAEMVIYLPAQSVDEAPVLDELTPREIVRELDKYVIGQPDAKRAVAIALRNRIRRQKLPPEMADEVMPKNILMIGPTGVGKTELARRLAKLANSPFLKVEASKFTEVGYVGPRRRIDDPRSGRYRDRHGPRRAARRDRRPRRSERREPSARSADAARAAGGRRQREDARKAARAPARRQARRAHGRDRRQGSRPDASRSPATAIRGDGHQPQGHAARVVRPRGSQKRKMRVARSDGLSGPGRRAEADRHGPGDAHRHRARGIERHHLPGRNRQDRRARRRPWPRREPRRRAARHSADRRRHHGQHALRFRAHGSHSVHRGGRVPRFEAQRPDSGTAGPLSHSRGAEIADRGRFHPHSERAEERADQAVSRCWIPKASS